MQFCCVLCPSFCVLFKCVSLVIFFFEFFLLLINKTEIGDGKVESLTLRNVEDCRCLRCFMISTIPLYVYQNDMLYQSICMLLIRFRYFDIFEDLTINRCTLEGDVRKPSRHENEGPLLICFLLFLVHDGHKPKAIAEIMKF